MTENREDYVSKKTIKILNQRYIDFFQNQSKKEIVFSSKSNQIFELYLPLLKYEYLNGDIKSNSIYALSRLIESYFFLKNLNIISSLEFKKLESFLVLFPNFDYNNYKNNKHYIIPESCLEMFGNINSPNIFFVNNNCQFIIDIIVLEENLKNF